MTERPVSYNGLAKAFIASQKVLLRLSTALAIDPVYNRQDPTAYWKEKISEVENLKLVRSLNVYLYLQDDSPDELLSAIQGASDLDIRALGFVLTGEVPGDDRLAKRVRELVNLIYEVDAARVKRRRAGESNDAAT